MKILVIDVESSCWEGGRPPSGQISEVIEVGGAVLEQDPQSSWEVTDSFGILIQPERSTVSQYCEELTGITQKALEDCGNTLEDAMEMVEGIGSTVWGSWGDYDYNMLRDECKSKYIKYRLPYAHLNIKALASAWFVVGTMGMKRMLGHLGMVHEGRHHRGEDDAKNIARILRKILNERKLS